MNLELGKLTDVARETIAYLEWKVEVRQMSKETEVGDSTEVIGFGEEGEIYIYPASESNKFTVERELVERNYPHAPDDINVVTVARDCTFGNALSAVLNYYYQVMLDNALEYAEFLKDEVEKGEDRD